MRVSKLMAGRVSSAGFILGLTAQLSPSVSAEDKAPNIDPPLVIDGVTWTFHTLPPPKDERHVVEGHPRLLITKEDLPELRLKLEHPVYQSRMQQLQKLAGKGDMAANALLYLAGYGDQYGQKAKAALLLGEWSGTPSGDQASLRGYSAVATYDWVFELMTPTEREQAFQNVHGMLLARGHGGTGFYGNDPYSRWPGLFRPWLGLAAKGEGVDDTTVEEILVHAYGDIQDDQHWGMYEPERGKAVLDVLNTIGLDTGGSQAGNHINSPTSGYTSMYLKGGPLFVFGWDTATGGTERDPVGENAAQEVGHRAAR